MNLKTEEFRNVVITEQQKNEEAFKTRMREELIQLDEKLCAITEVCTNPKSNIKVCVKEARLLEGQKWAMRNYLISLKDRCLLHDICIEPINQIMTDSNNVGCCDEWNKEIR